jgi:hypothetical protein
MTMKYFTPERWLRLQDTSNKTAWSAAFADWEQAVLGYEEVVKRLAAEAPELRPFLEAESLHDGLVLAYGIHGPEKENFFLLVRPCWPDGQLVLLSYHLLAPPTVHTSALPAEWRNELAEWMYDEVGIEDVQLRVRRLADGGEPPGNVAFRVGKKLVWDPAGMKAKGCPEADAFIRREYRKGWRLG